MRQGSAVKGGQQQHSHEEQCSRARGGSAHIPMCKLASRQQRQPPLHPSHQPTCQRCQAEAMASSQERWVAAQLARKASRAASHVSPVLSLAACALHQEGNEGAGD